MLILTVFSASFAYSQQSRTEIRVDFRVNSSTIDPAYNDNARRTEEIVAFFRRLEADSTQRITSVVFCGTASPEGHYLLNRRLAHRRLEALEKLVRSRITIPDSLISRNDEYIPWEYLAEVVAGSDMKQKAEVLAIIEREPRLVEYPAGRHVDSRVPALKQIDGGKVWNMLMHRYFASMRNASAVFITCKRVPLPVVETHEEPEPEPEPEPQPEPAPEPETAPAPEPAEVDTLPAPLPEEWHRELHIKTNLAELALAIANIAVEVDLAEHWSLTLPIRYSAWDYFTSTVKFRTFSLQPEARYWFDQNNDRWFVGAHLGLVYYNVATGGTYRTQDHNGTSPSLGGGLSVGYRLPVSRNKRWKMEFTIGAGVYPLHYDRFRNYPNGLLVYTERRTYFGIDQASIALAYTIDLNRKGGRK